MKKYLSILIVLLLSSIINSCAIQTNVIKSMHDVKKSILKIETWARIGGCGEESMTCAKYELLSMGSGAVVLYDNKKAVLTAAHVCKQMKFELFIQKEKGDFYDEFDKWACFGYLHALLFVNGAIKSKYNKGE